MTGRWPAAPPERPWRDLDPALETLARVVEDGPARARVLRARWEPDRRASAVVASPPGEPASVTLVEVSEGATTRCRLLHDPALPGVARALEGRDLLARLAGLLGEAVLEAAPRVESYHPGSRCVLRWEVLTTGGRRTLYTKVLASGADRYQAVSAELERAARARQHPALVPPVLAVWPDLQMVVTPAIPGRTASGFLADGEASVAAREAVARGVGALLAAVHSTTTDVLAGSDAVARPETTLAEARSCLPALWRVDPVAAPSLAALLADLPDAAPEPLPPVLAHGSFRPGQVVHGTAGLTVLDLDAVCLADPASDLGHALAHLAWQAIRAPEPDDAVPALARALLHGYEDGGGKAEPSAVAWWQAAAMAKLAGRRVRALAVHEWPLVPALLCAARDLLEGRPSTPPRSSTAELLDPVRMTRQLAPVLAGACEGRRPRITAAEPLARAHGRRCVVRYQVAAPRGAGDVIAKAYAEGHRAALAHDTMSALGAHGDEEVATPRPLGVLPRYGMVLYHATSGAPLHDVVPEVAVPVAGRAGGWLARLHRSPVRLQRQVDLAREVVNLGAWAREVSRHDRRLEQPSLRLAAALAAAASRLPAQVPLVPIHKDLHPGHVLVDPAGALAVIDLDEARMGDAAFDVAHMTSYLEELGEPWSASAAAAFLEGYGEVPGDQVERRVGFYAAYARLKLAKQLARGTNRRWARGDDDRRVAELLERGLACLDA